MKTRTKMLSSILVIGVLGGLVALGVSGAFTATTNNDGNEIRTGSVAVSDNDAGKALFTVDNAKPGDSWTRCIQVSYDGSLPSDMRAYMENVPGPLTDYMNLKVESGTQDKASFPGCDGFTADKDVYDGQASSAILGDWANGLVVNPKSKTVWEQGDTAVFRITLDLSDKAPNAVQSESTGNATFVWEARNAS